MTNAAAGTIFCLKAGVYSLSSAVVPEPGDRLIGEYGAILDGGAVPTSGNHLTDGIIRAWGTGAHNVTIRNLVIRNYAMRCIAALGVSDWLIDHNEVTGCETGIHHALGATVSNNYVHHNTRYGMGGWTADGSLIVHNEVSFNNTAGWKQADEGGAKWTVLSDLTVRDNWFHDNTGNEIWLDGTETGNIVENNRVNNDATGHGIQIEIALRTVVRNNVITAPASTTGGAGIFISTSRDVEVYGNTVTHGSTHWFYSGIHSFFDGTRGHVSANNFFHDNTIRVVNGTHAAALQEYKGANPNRGTHRFENNHYDVLNLGGTYWAYLGTWRTWDGWRAQGFDSLGQGLDATPLTD